MLLYPLMEDPGSGSDWYTFLIWKHWRICLRSVFGLREMSSWWILQKKNFFVKNTLKNIKYKIKKAMCVSLKPELFPIKEPLPPLKTHKSKFLIAHKSKFLIAVCISEFARLICSKVYSEI